MPQGGEKNRLLQRQDESYSVLETNCMFKGVRICNKMTSTSEPIIKKNLGSIPFHQTELEEINYNRQFIYLFF